jgi:hypothetical protein
VGVLNSSLVVSLEEPSGGSRWMAKSVLDVAPGFVAPGFVASVAHRIAQREAAECSSRW